MRTLSSGLVLAVLAALLFVDAPTVSAQDVQITGPLAGAPACRRCRIYRAGRIQLQPLVAFTLQDEFTRTIPIGLQAQYHFTDWLGLGVWGAWGGVSLDTGLTDEVQQQGQTTPRNRLSLPRADTFPDQIGKLKLFAGAHLAFIPLRGKLSLFQKLFIDTDLYFFLGAAAVQVEEREDVLDPNICSRAAAMTSGACLATASSSARATRFAVAPTFGVGLMLYATDFFGVSFEWRGMPFAWNTSGTDEGSADNEFPDGLIDENDRIFHFNHMFVLGFAFYLPTQVQVNE